MNAGRSSTTAQRLKEIMDERGLKQVDILTLCRPYCIEYGVKINKSHLSQWLHGTNEPSQKKLTILAKALNVSEPWLMGYDISPESKPGMYIMTNTMAFRSEAYDKILEGLDTRNKQIQKLQRIVAKMSPEELNRMTEMAKLMYPEKFEEEDDK